MKFTAVQKGDPPFAGHEVGPLIGHVVDGPFDPVADFGICRSPRGPAHFVFDFHRHGQAVGLVFIEFDPDVLPFFRAAFHFGKGHEDASFRSDVNEGAEARRIDDRRITDLADLDLGQAHGRRKAARWVVVQKDRHRIADMDLFRLLIDMEEDVVIGIARAAVQKGTHLALAQDF